METNQEHVVKALESVLEGAKEGKFDSVVIIVKHSDSKEIGAAWANLTTYDLGGMVMSGLQFILGKQEEQSTETESE